MSKEENTIPLETAIAWAQEWRQDESDYNKYNSCKAFLIPAVDLEEALAEIKRQLGDDYAKIRAYIGVENNPSDPDHQFTEKLMLVGTKPETQPDGRIIYRDILPESTDKYGNELGAAEGSVWDFTNPCPPDCDEKSPLN